MEKPKNKTLINLSTKTFIEVVILLFVLMLVAVVLTYVIPKGEFGVLLDGTTDFSTYRPVDNAKGIPIWKGLLAPILVFGSSNGLTLIMLSLFLVVVFAAFQVMNDVGGIRALVGAVAARFQKRRTLLLCMIALVFMAFGAFLGLFEEMLSMLPIVTALCVLIGYDSFTGFLVCIIACGFGFASAITNPFTVLLASEIIGANPMEHIWYRIVIFAVMYALLLGFVFLYVRKLKKDPTSSLTLAHDEALRAAGKADEANAPAPRDEKRIRLTYIVFLLVCLGLIITCSAVPALRDYTVVVLIAYFLIFGLLAGYLSAKAAKPVLRSFWKGIVGALPTIVFIALASSIKYVFDEGGIMPTVVHSINTLVSGHSPFVVALVLYAIILVLEFFISSSTAKAILVMGMLAVVSVPLSKQMLVLIYTFADGYTNVLFPTSPVLLISLSMIGVDYFKWVKKSVPLFVLNLALVVGFIALGITLGY
ncbi:MAG: YfcC family protein [Clostridia bacterium]|nr:YfcC family protein [Clostridia bacterium]